MARESSAAQPQTHRHCFRWQKSAYSPHHIYRMSLRQTIQPLIHSAATASLAATLAGRLEAAEPQASETVDSNPYMCNVRDFGAKGDGKKLDTAAINHAIEACAAQGGGKVLLPPGRYLSGTVHLRSHVALFLDTGAMLIGATNLDGYAQPAIPTILPEAKWGKWHRALIVGENLEDISITGPGVINGNKVFDPTGEEKMRGPHTIALVNCKRFTLRDVSIVDSANYALFFQLSDDVDIGNVKITGGWDGVHFRGAPARPRCSDPVAPGDSRSGTVSVGAQRNALRSAGLRAFERGVERLSYRVDSADDQRDRRPGQGGVAGTGHRSAHICVSRPPG